MGSLLDTGWVRDWMDWWRGSDRGAINVTPHTMVTSAAVYFAINKIAGDVGMAPLDPREAGPDGRGSNILINHPTYRLLRTAPNGWQTADVFKGQIQSHALGWGNGRAYIRRVNGVPVELIPLMPDRTKTVIAKGQKYHVTNPTEDDPLKFAEGVREAVIQNPRIPQDWLVLPDHDVLHVMGMTHNGYDGLSIADLARDSIGSDLSAQRFTKRQLNNGLSNRLMLEAPPGTFRTMDEEEQFLQKINERHGNTEDAKTVGLLRLGIKAHVLQMSNVDAQFIEQRKFNRQDVMLWFGLQHIPGDNSSVSYNSLEQKQLAELASCVNFWFTRWEHQCDAKLQTPKEQAAGRMYFKFNRASRVSTDLATTANVLTKLVQMEIISSNEARDKLDMNPRTGGDEFRNPSINTQDRPSQSSDQSAAAEFKEEMIRLSTVEAKRVIDGTGAKNFLDWIEDFYARWCVTLAAEVARFDAQFSVEDYIQAHKQELVNTAGTAKNQAELRGAVSALVARWSNMEDWFND